MLDALLPASRAFTAAVADGKSHAEAHEKMAAAAEKGAEATKSMHASAGRRAYVPEAHQGGIPDPGAMAAAAWLRALGVAASRP